MAPVVTTVSLPQCLYNTHTISFEHEQGPAVQIAPEFVAWVPFKKFVGQAGTLKRSHLTGTGMWWALLLSRALSLSLSLSLFLSLSLPLSLSHCCSVSVRASFSFTLLFFSIPASFHTHLPSLSLTHSLALSSTHTLTCSLFHSLTCPLFHAHTHRVHTCPLFHAYVSVIHSLPLHTWRGRFPPNFSAF